MTEESTLFLLKADCFRSSMQLKPLRYVIIPVSEDANISGNFLDGKNKYVIVDALLVRNLGSMFCVFILFTLRVLICINVR